MVYVGGTDPGRFIPTLLNETGDGERHVVLTQNALADGTYLEYLRFLDGDRMTALRRRIRSARFRTISADAQKRLAHDQQFPDEPKQVRPGEDIRHTDNRVQVSGQVAVMAINERAVPDDNGQESRPFLRTGGILSLQIHLSQRRPARSDHGARGPGRAEDLHR